MQSYLYDDLYELEDSHWWHRAKRRLVINAYQTVYADSAAADSRCRLRNRKKY